MFSFVFVLKHFQDSIEIPIIVPQFYRLMRREKENMTPNWFFYAVGAAILYGAHQIFTKLASARISDGLGGFVVEFSAALTILAYLAYLRLFDKWDQTGSPA